MADTDTVRSFPEADPEADIVAENLPPPAGPASPPPRKPGTLPAVFGGVVAAALGFGAAQFVPDGWPLQSTAALETTLATHGTALADAQTEIARLSSAIAELQARPSADPALAEQIAELGARPPFDAAPLLARIATLEQDLARIAALPTDGSATSPAALAAQATALAALQAEVAALRGNAGSAADVTAAAQTAAAQIAEAETRAAELRAAAEADAAKALARTSLRQLAVALETGGPFETALAGLGGVEIPAILTGNAAAGLPTLNDLQSTFPDAARTALEAALRADMGEGWGDRLASFLRSQTGARSTTPREGDDPDAVLSRAEAALQGGSVPEALAVMAGLPEISKTTMAPWIASANSFVEGQQALANLAQTLGGQE